MSMSFKPAESLEAHHLRMARSGLDLTVRELAVLSDMNKATIVRIEAGYPVRQSTITAVRRTLEDNGAKFVTCNDSSDILVSVTRN